MRVRDESPVHCMGTYQQALHAARMYTAEHAHGRSDACELWMEYHQANPHVLTILTEILLEAKFERGFGRWSIQGAMEVARWERRFETDGEFKISNEVGAYYSRYIMMMRPELYNFMKTKPS